MRVLTALPLVAALVACGPIRSTRSLIAADVELEAARAAGAQKTAVYEYTAAEAYLHQSRVVAGYAQYQASEEYADKALKFAQEAKKKALAATGKPAEAQ
ncbi:MAG TPA: hypothetical protein VIV59_13070 [Anaeromyxobacteraceae bacterium]